jgi:DNA-binding NtrC family response regulator
MGTAKTNIFIVDDDKAFTLALKADIETIFAKKSVKIHSFETGEACMEKFNQEKPQVVILDYNLNSMKPDAANGIKILSRIKKESPKTNVVMLTGDDHIDIALKSFHLGASDYVVKTETQFKKINYSLQNIFKIMEAKSEATIYKYIVIGFFMLIAVGIIAIIMNPSVLTRGTY